MSSQYIFYVRRKVEPAHHPGTVQHINSGKPAAKKKRPTPSRPSNRQVHHPMVNVFKLGQYLIP